MTSQDGCAKNQTDLAWFVTAGVQAGRALTAAIAETDAGVKFLAPSRGPIRTFEVELEKTRVRR